MNQVNPSQVPPPPLTAWATVCRTAKFIAVDTWSGYRRSALDDQGHHVLLSTSVSDEELGSSVLVALDASRFLKLAETSSFFDLVNLKARVAARDANWMSAGDYKKRRELFKGMESCNIHKRHAQTHVAPMRQDREDGWDGMGKDAELVRPENVTAAELGAAVKLALDRSGGK